MKSIALSLAAASALFAGAATAQDYEGSRIVQYLDDTASLSAVLAEIDATRTDSEDGEGQQRIVFSNGLIAMGDYRVCQSGASDCNGMRLIASYGAVEGVSRTDLLQRANLFNGSYNTAKAIVRDDGSVYLTRYIISDGGISMENFRVGLSVFANMREPFETIVLDGGTMN